MPEIAVTSFVVDVILPVKFSEIGVGDAILRGMPLVYISAYTVPAVSLEKTVQYHPAGLVDPPKLAEK